MTTTSEHERLPRAVVLGWALGAFPQAIASYAFSVLLFRYLTDTVALGAALVGTMIAVSKVYDGLIDPTIGYVSDRIETRMGRRRPLMLLGGVLLASSIAVLFTVPLDASVAVKIAWASAGLLLFSSGYSLFAIPWLAMPAEMTDDYHERTGMMAWRVLFATSGQSAGSLGGPVLLSVLGVGALAYGRMGLLIAAAGLAATFATIVLTRKARWGLPETAPRPSALGQLKLALANRPFLVIVMLKGALYFGASVHAGAMALFVRRVMHVSDLWLGAGSLAGAFAAVASQPLWVALSRRFGKRTALTIGLVWQGLALAGFFLLGPGWPPQSLIVLGVLLGAASGGVFMLAQSMLPDIIEYDYRVTGMRRAGAYAGAVSFLETSCGALGILVLGLVLSGSGYVSGVADPVGGQPASAILAIRACCALIPAAAAGLCLAALSRYDLTEARLRALGA